MKILNRLQKRLSNIAIYVSSDLIMDNSAEIQFSNKIDCALPYNDKAAMIELVNESLLITSNSTYRIVEELCRIPFSLQNEVDRTLLLEMLIYIDNIFDHPIKTAVFDVARLMIGGSFLSSSEVLKRMELLKSYPDNYAALSIIYSSEIEPSDEVDAAYKEIVDSWS